MGQQHVPKNCVRQLRRLEEEDDESSEERELGAPLGAFSDVCQKKLTKPNGSTKSGKKAVCTLCSACTDYTSGWCADNCDNVVRISNKNRIIGLTGCIAGDQQHVPKNCVRQLRRLEEEDDESSEERELG